MRFGCRHGCAVFDVRLRYFSLKPFAVVGFACQHIGVAIGIGVFSKRHNRPDDQTEVAAVDVVERTDTLI